MKATLLFGLAALLAGCSGAGQSPSLSPRPIEQQADSLLAEPNTPPPTPAAADPATIARVEALVAQARGANGEFASALAAATRAVAARGAEGSEGWIVAQEALSRVEVAREPVRAALADLDAERRRAALGPLSDDLGVVERGVGTVEAIDREQAAAYDRLMAELSRR